MLCILLNVTLQVVLLKCARNWSTGVMHNAHKHTLKREFCKLLAMRFAARMPFENGNFIDPSQIYIGPSIKDVRKILPIFDPPLPPCPHLSALSRPPSHRASVRQNLYCVVNFLRDSGYDI